MNDNDFRLATRADESFVSRANLAWLQDQHAAGGPLLVTTNNHHVHMALYWSYMAGDRDGVVVVYQPPGKPQLGFAMAGEDRYPPRWDTNQGRIAYVWLTWVDPVERRHGIGLAMLLWGRPKLLAKGFKVAACATLQSNPGGANLARAYGIQPVETAYQIKL